MHLEKKGKGCNTTQSFTCPACMHTAIHIFCLCGFRPSQSYILLHFWELFFIYTSYIQSVVVCRFINIEDNRNSMKHKLSNKHNYAHNQELFQLTQYHLYQKQKISFPSCRTATKSGQIYISINYLWLTFYSSLSRHIPCH